MKNLKLSFVLAATIVLTSCGDSSSENSSVSAWEAIPATALKNVNGGTNCSTGGGPRLVFVGASTGGRADFSTSIHGNVPNANACLAYNGISVDRGYRIRLKSIHIKGSHKIMNSATGTIKVQAGLSSIGLTSTTLNLSKALASPFTKVQTLSVENWTPCSKANGTAQKINILPSLTSTTGATATLDEVKVVVEAERCIP